MRVSALRSLARAPPAPRHHAPQPLRGLTPLSRRSSNMTESFPAPPQSRINIGTWGTPWSEEERAEWRASVDIERRSYAVDVLPKIEALKERFDVVPYGSLPYDASDPDGRYPLFAVKSKGWNASKPSVLVTGGVHGYETSGVQGALKFLDTRAPDFVGAFNIVVAPCVSPWGYERVQRWNALAVDPNRSFVKEGGVTPPSEEAAALMRFVESLNVENWMVHIDLHETTDTDESEFRPAKAARDGVDYEADVIPDGFYLVCDTENPSPTFQAAIIQSVERVTHIAPGGPKNQIIGEPVVQRGVISYAAAKLGLCAGVTNAKYTTTTEVYPDSPSASAAQCDDAQVAAVVGGLEHVLVAEGLYVQ
mmetsp:Transcript_15499/g.37504  ORF Transcript_15499/g.37504 Transcript_15499/m.37504 type:complete len:364 (+) Transcript_15499:51-1142(+)